MDASNGKRAVRVNCMIRGGPVGVGIYGIEGRSTAKGVKTIGNSQRGWYVSASDKVDPATNLFLKVDPIPATQ